MLKGFIDPIRKFIMGSMAKERHFSMPTLVILLAYYPPGIVCKKAFFFNL